LEGFRLSPWRFAIFTEIGANSGTQLRFVARPDLAHLDPAPEAMGHVADQLAKIDPLLGREVAGDTPPGEGGLDLDHLHVQPQLFHP
jgi:hypothetical protein